MEAMTESGFEQFRQMAKATNETCGECGCKLYAHMRSGRRLCRNGHQPSADVCEDCGEEIMSTHLGDLCGCDD